MPHWTSEHFHNAHDALHELDRVLHLSIRGISQLSKSASLVEAVADYDRIVRGEEGNSAESTQRIEAARREAAFAQKEIDRGFPVLHAHSVIGLWGVFEAFVEDLAIAFLEHDRSLLAKPALAAIRITLADFEQLDAVERLRYLVTEYSRASRADFKQGVSRFEAILDLVSMSGPVNDDLRKMLFELNHIRNVLVHRGAVADRKLVTACPWLNLTVGQKVEIDHAQYVRYRSAIEAYFVELMIRSLVCQGRTREEAEAVLRPQSGGATTEGTDA